MKRPFIAPHRKVLLAHAHGDVLEIGFGTGLNLPYYPRQVRKIAAIDPNVGMNGLARKRAKASAIEVDLRFLSGEQLPFDDFAFDCAVSTWTLCSIEDVGKALREVYRVLKPGGRFLFLEHGLSPDLGVQKWQRRLNWLETRVADGCHLDRDIKALIAAHPFAAVEIDEFYMPKVPWTHGYLYRGIATKAGA